MCIFVNFLGDPHTCGQIYSYPAKRWKKRKRSFFTSDLRIAQTAVVDNEAGISVYNSLLKLEFSVHFS